VFAIFMIERSLGLVW